MGDRGRTGLLDRWGAAGVYTLPLPWWMHRKEVSGVPRGRITASLSVSALTHAVTREARRRFGGGVYLGRDGPIR